MGQFKPMVKMETTEPSVELKLKKGGSVKMKKGGKAEAGHKKMAMGGGAMGALAGTPALLGRPAINAPVQTPGKPSMMARRKAMMAKPAITPSGPSMAMPPMKKGGKAKKMAEGGDMESKADERKEEKMDMAKDKAMIKKAFKQHDTQEHKGGKGTELKLKKGGMKKYATGGVILGNGGGFKDGGIISEETSAKGSGPYRNTKMVTAEYSGKSSGKTGDVKDGNGGGYATGGVILGNGGGFKKGGKASKKAYATGGTVNSGKPVAMPQGRKPVPSPVRISQLAGTYKNGGRATPAESRLLKNNATENKSAMRDAKTNSNLKYGSPKRMKDGGSSDMSNGAYDAHYANEKAENEAMRNMVLGAPKRLMDSVKGLFTPKTPEGSVTKTEKSVTVAPPGRKRGGMAC